MPNRVWKANNGSKNFIIILLVVFLIVLAISMGAMFRNGRTAKKDQSESGSLISTETESQLEAETETEIETEIEVDVLEQLGINIPEKNLNWEELWAENEHIYAWIYIPNTNVDYPVLQHPTDDSFYLNRNLDGSEGYPGCIYSEHRYNAKDWSDFNTLLYGHNMKDGTMFKTLHKFEDGTFFEENRYVYIYMPEYVYVYDIFAAYEYSDTHILANYNDETTETRQQYINDVLSECEGAEAHLRDGVEVTPESCLLTMSTCIGGKPNNRYLVQGVLVNPPVVEEVITE